jgi:hypothetical protein
VATLAACAIAPTRDTSTSASSTSSASTMAGGPHDGTCSGDPVIEERRDLISARGVDACRDHSNRARDYATASLFNVVSLHFEILRVSLCRERSVSRCGRRCRRPEWGRAAGPQVQGGELRRHEHRDPSPPESYLSFFCRFVYLRHKATEQLTLPWLSVRRTLGLGLVRSTGN